VRVRQRLLAVVRASRAVGRLGSHRQIGTEMLAFVGLPSGQMLASPPCAGAIDRPLGMLELMQPYEKVFLINPCFLPMVMI